MLHKNIKLGIDYNNKLINAFYQGPRTNNRVLRESQHVYVLELDAARVVMKMVEDESCVCVSGGG